MEQSKITIKVMRRGALAALPKQMHKGDAGFDLVANSRKVDLENNCMVYGTGLRVVFKGLNACYELGERIAQAVILPVPEVEYVDACELSESDRGEGGLGSTGF